MAPQSSVPPSLPPSVEEAYRRKCVQLKNRTNEVEEANEAARTRLARIKRQVEKLRIERAFLLEQLAKRTSTNVEDSEGSPSPPPTDNTHIDLINSGLDANPRKPKEKPLRTKRGHRKPSAVGDADTKSATAADSFNQPPSPGSESFSHPPDAKSAHANGVSQAHTEPSNAFELYCRENRPALKAKTEDPEDSLEDKLEQAWKELPEAEKDEFQARFEKQKTAEPSADKGPEDEVEAEVEVEAEAEAAAETETETQKKDAGPDEVKPETQDEDVEMGNYDTEDPENAADKDGDD